MSRRCRIPDQRSPLKMIEFNGYLCVDIDSNVNDNRESIYARDFSVFSCCITEEAIVPIISNDRQRQNVSVTKEVNMCICAPMNR